MKNSDNFNFRNCGVQYLNCDIFCVVETFLRGNESLALPAGYTFYGHNRGNLHNNARRGSGGVGVFVRDSLVQLYDISVIDKTIEDIMWLKFSSKLGTDNLVLCVCYLPPAESTRHVDAETFYCNLLEQVYAYQNMGQMFICGDLNSRVGTDTDYIEGVDDMRPRDIIDHVSNSNGDLLVDFLVDCGICMVNGRIGENKFTHVSHRGNSVVDYVLTPYEQLIRVKEFSITYMSDLINALQMQGNSKIPDHSVLIWSLSVTSNRIHKHHVNENQSVGKPNYNTSRNYELFLSDIEVRTRVSATIDKIESALRNQSDVNEVYTAFTSLIFDEISQHFPRRGNFNGNKNAKSFYKPYWSEHLQRQWDIVCKNEKLWLKCNGPQKRNFRDSFNRERKIFDKMNRKAKRAFQLSEQNRLGDLCDNRDSRNFWKEIGKVGMQNERKLEIPMEVIDEQGNISSDTQSVLSRWKRDYSTLFSEHGLTDSFNDENLQRIKLCLESNTVPSVHRDTSELNCPITIQEVKSCIYKAKLKGAVGLDNILASVLSNERCIRMLHTIISYCFNNGVVPSEWSAGLIKPIPKSDSKDPRYPLSYRGITLISIPCKIYADILNVRLNKWINEYGLVADEQNGFRKNRSCIEHIYALYSIINKRKMQKRSTFVCFVDAKKAFDRVQRDCLWFKLISIGIEGKMLKAIQSLYHDLKCAVKVNNMQTSYFDVDIGVKQGCKVSPTLFSLYVNDLADKIRTLNCGIDVDGYQLSILLYADDIALLSPCEESLQIMLNALNEWCDNWRVTLNQEKTKIVHFRPCGIDQCDFSFSCGDVKLSYAQSYKYLGLWFHENLDMKFATSELAKSASRALSALYTKYLYLGGMNYKTWKKTL